MKIADIANNQNKKLVFINVTINWFCILVVSHVINFYPRYNSRE